VRTFVHLIDNLATKDAMVSVKILSKIIMALKVTYIELMKSKSVTLYSPLLNCLVGIFDLYLVVDEVTSGIK